MAKVYKDLPVSALTEHLNLDTIKDYATANIDFQKRLTDILGRSDFAVSLKRVGAYTHVNLVDAKNGLIAYGLLTQLAGCCGVCVSTRAAVDAKYQKRGVGLLMNELRQEIAYQLGYTILICTDVVIHYANRKLLARACWKDVLAFKNRRTGRDVVMSYIDLKERAANRPKETEQ